jgi:CBS domain containing-hemolysin-like protein
MLKTENKSETESPQGKELEKQPTRFWRKLFRKFSPNAAIHRDDLVEGLSDEDNAHADSFSEDEKRFLKNILILRARNVEDVMVRRAQISALDVSARIEEVQAAFESTGHSRLPVYRDTLDHPLGVLHIKDVFKLLAQRKKNINLEKIIHPPLFAPPSMKVADLLSKMQKQRLHMALVIDEHGGTNGLVSIEDLVEEIVGEIEDEHNKDEGSTRRFVRRRDGSLEVKPEMTLAELEEIMGKKLVEDARQNETIGRLTAALFGKVPAKGDRIALNDDVVIEVRSADLRRVQQLRIYPATKIK